MLLKLAMPIYEYRCRKCGNVVEKIQKFSDPPLKQHSGCGGVLTKLISQSSFHLKGSGWYVTDYAGKGTKDADAGAAEKSVPDNGESKAASDDAGGDKEKSRAKESGTGETSAKKAEKPTPKKSDGGTKS